MYLLCIVLSLCVVTLALLYDSSPEELLGVPIKFLAIECAGVKVLIVMEIVISIVKLNRAWSRHSVAVVGGVSSGINATVHLQLPESYCRAGRCRGSRVPHSPC